LLRQQTISIKRKEIEIKGDAIISQRALAMMENRKQRRKAKKPKRSQSNASTARAIII
jgi:ubiquinone biosynthesis protein UbiJ